MVMLGRAVENLKAMAPIYLTLVGMMMRVRLGQDPKATLAMEVRDVGMSMLGNKLHDSKALLPIKVTLVGIVTLVRLVQN